MDFILPNIGEGIETISVSEILVKKNQKMISGETIIAIKN